MSLSKRSPNHIHFIGIGGSGMSGLAEVVCNLGYVVTGSDILQTTITERLISLGIKIDHNHKPSNLRSADMVVISSAINENNPELETYNFIKGSTYLNSNRISSYIQASSNNYLLSNNGKWAKQGGSHFKHL